LRTVESPIRISEGSAGLAGSGSTTWARAGSVLTAAAAGVCAVAQPAQASNSMRGTIKVRGRHGTVSCSCRSILCGFYAAIAAVRSKTLKKNQQNERIQA
jgi:hypothetical protein